MDFKTWLTFLFQHRLLMMKCFQQFSIYWDCKHFKSLSNCYTITVTAIKHQLNNKIGFVTSSLNAEKTIRQYPNWGGFYRWFRWHRAFPSSFFNAECSLQKTTTKTFNHHLIRKYPSLLVSVTVYWSAVPWLRRKFSTNKASSSTSLTCSKKLVII